MLMLDLPQLGFWDLVRRMPAKQVSDREVRLLKLRRNTKIFEGDESI
jgi:hypothetical protein